MSDLQVMIEYPKNGKYQISGNVKQTYVPELINNFLMDQMGKGEDNRKPEKREKYTILIEVDLSCDGFNASDNTGNKGLRDGILMDVSKREMERLGLQRVNLEDSLKFQKHLDEATAEVRTWPLWKQTILGPCLPEHNLAEGGVENG